MGAVTLGTRFGCSGQDLPMGWRGQQSSGWGRSSSRRALGHKPRGEPSWRFPPSTSARREPERNDFPPECRFHRLKGFPALQLIQATLRRIERVSKDGRREQRYLPALAGARGRGGEPKGRTFMCVAANGSLPRRWPLCHALAYLQSEMD